MAAAATALAPNATNGESPKLVKKIGANSTATTQTVFGCPHIKNLLQQARTQAVDGYTKVITSLQKEGNLSDRIHKSGAAPTTSARGTFLCLQCPYVSNVREKHHKSHGFSVDSSTGFIYCIECKDFVYDTTFEEVRTASSTRKRKLSATLPDTDRRLVSANSAATPCAATGLRGLYNMGQTCFMSVVLQSLIHNPFLRTYYLSEGHRANDCEREACTSCALDAIFDDFFAQEKHEGYGAVHMLQGCWKGGGSLAGYSQQDAHEFLGFILNSLHEAITEDDEKMKKSKNGKDCTCVIHQTFGGQLRSTVTCLTCRTTNVTFDPFMDLSLDVKGAGPVPKKKKLNAANGAQAKDVAPMDLSECLERYTSAETLSSDSYHCRKCNASSEAKKRLSLSRLPPVVPIHLKRFSHSKANSQSSKDALSQTHTPDAKYLLSSVVVHKGKIDNGHYISYARQNREWFRFDDSMVVRVEEKEVLCAEAYMLFYVIEEI
ncbi:cysteine proteinase [Dissoconium aciculare CBS 342.82]|uniref:Ubiquitin carboxyl-terminal hydrolase n=1 Tax=Dissoconium aciculare CBS 342.82 TaxID=1314786 RepID=A0A6J3MAA7_9PEZI|nr:cysteine proteinase [Dissoconium aciculare CBS 342.82]KAF1824961.1 cysteine proteinase [Dissoconium aciculare CBS 342.82]